jgi:hypothetical protein
MIYQNITHGSSLNTLLKASELNSPLILLIRDIDGSVFGAYLSDYLRMMPHQFFGAGETFLFCFRVFFPTNLRTHISPRITGPQGTKISFFATLTA